MMAQIMNGGRTLPKGTSGILLLLLAMFLLMLAISGRFHDIFTAAFPSLGGSTSSGSTGGSGSAGNTAPPVYGGSTGQPFVGDPGAPPASTDYTKQIYQSGGYQIVPSNNGGFQYVTG